MNMFLVTHYNPHRPYFTPIVSGSGDMLDLWIALGIVAVIVTILMMYINQLEEIEE